MKRSDFLVELVMLQIVGGRGSSWNLNGGAEFGAKSESGSVESDWVDVNGDLYHWTKGLRPVQVDLL